MENLALLPAALPEASLLVCIFIGIIVTSFGVTRFGWPVSGLVVPGLAAASLLASPEQFAWLVAASLLTYWGVSLTFAMMRRLSIAPPFGRDRFFVILCVGLLAQAVLQWISYQHSDSLPATLAKSLRYFPAWTTLLIPLCANQFWKVGTIRGLKILGINTLVTYGIAVFFLPYLVDFNPLDLAYLATDRQQGIMQQPLQFLLIAVTAACASSLNLKLGWDFGGILIPALLVSVFLDPLKMMAMGVEVILVYALGQLLLTFFRNAEPTGINKLRLFFSIAFAVRISGYLFMGYFYPEYRFEDYEGVGFILSALIASHASQKGGLLRFSAPTLIAVPLLATLMFAVAYVTLVPEHPLSLAIGTAQATNADRHQFEEKRVSLDEPIEFRAATPQINLEQFMQLTSAMSRSILILNGEGCIQCQEFQVSVLEPTSALFNSNSKAFDVERLSEIENNAARLGYRVLHVVDRKRHDFYVLAPKDSERAVFGLFAFRRHEDVAKRPPSSQVSLYLPPEALLEGAFESAMALFLRTQAKSIFIDTSRTNDSLGMKQRRVIDDYRQTYRHSILTTMLDLHKGELGDKRLVVLAALSPLTRLPGSIHAVHSKVLSGSRSASEAKDLWTMASLSTIPRIQMPLTGQILPEEVHLLAKRAYGLEIDALCFTRQSMRAFLDSAPLQLAINPLLNAASHSPPRPGE